MADPINKPTVCPVLIGREAHLEALLRCLDQTRAGPGQTVLITGEGGIGKSRLVAEARPAAERAGFQILQGACFEPDRSLPYAPIVDLLRTSLVVSDDTGHVVPTAPELRALLPELIAERWEAEPDRTANPEQEKRRLFVALERLIAQLAAAQPVLMIVEDVHWSDEASLEFLLYLARRIAARPILLLLTYRSDEIHEDLRRVLAELDRARLAAEIRLAPLSNADVEAMLRAIFTLDSRVGDQPNLSRSGIVSDIATLTEGNPFFIEEVIRTLISADDLRAGDERLAQAGTDTLHIPRSVDDAVRRRAARLSPAASHVLMLAAVAGRRFDVPLLMALTRHDEPALLQLIKELITAGLVVEESGELFAFQHALTRQAVYAGLLAHERRALHREIAETMEQLAGTAFEPRQADLAYHHFGAGQWPKALAHSRLAGEAAQRLNAPRSAIEHYTRALEAANWLVRPPQPGFNAPSFHDELPADLYLGRGRAHEITGDLERARIDYETALRSAELAADQRARWRALMALGLVWAERDYERTGDFYRRASDLAEALADPGLQASSLNRLGNWLANIGLPAEALAAHQQALALVTAKRDERAIAETLDLIGMAHGIADGDNHAASSHFKRASERFRALGDLVGLASSLTSFVTFSCAGNDEVVSSVLVQRDDCDKLLGEALGLARQVEWLSGQAYAEFAWSRALAGYGEFDDALEHGQQALAIAEEIEHQQWTCASLCILGCVYVAMLAPDAAIPHLERGCALARAVGSAWWTSWGTAYLAFAHLQRGAVTQAEATLAGAMPADHRPRNVGERWLVWARGELALVTGRPDEALRLADELLASVPGSASGQAIPALLKLKGEALTALGCPAETAAVLREARRGAEERGVLPLLWQVHRAQARLHRANREYAAARHACDEARGVIAALAATIDDDASRDQFMAAATATLPALPRGKPPSARRLETEQFEGVTRREREVAVEIARGGSNREIASRLFTTERTIASHVGNILAKLNFSSRAQIAVWARDKGLIAPE